MERGRDARAPSLARISHKVSTAADLLAMKGQAVAIARVIASGVTMFVMYLSNFESLRRTQQTYYDHQRFADVFVTAKRIPERVSDRPGRDPWRRHD
jgi:hypothetical protein